MNGTAAPGVRDVVLVGAGHAHVQVLRDFGMRPPEGVRLTLVTREVHTPYSGMLPGLVAGHYSFAQAHIDSEPLCRFAGARLYQDEVIGIDLAAKRILCRGGRPCPTTSCRSIPARPRIRQACRARRALHSREADRRVPGSLR